jgi:TonB family protein
VKDTRRLIATRGRLGYRGVYIQMNTGALFLATVTAFAQAGANPRPVSVSFANDLRSPTVVSEAAPEMPAVEASAARAEIDVEVAIATDGAVAHARIADSQPGRAAREQAALDAARRWRFRAPVDRGGRQSATLAVLRMTFEPASSGAPARTGGSLRWLQRVPLLPRSRAPEINVVHRVAASGVGNPSIIREVKPDYSEAAMRAKVQGTVVMEVLIMADGTVGYGDVSKGLGSGLDDEALIAARRWLFQPAVVNGKPVVCAATLILEFRLH